MDLKMLIVLIVSIVIGLADSKSFTIVLDTTVSMDVEINIIKSNMPAVARLLANSTEFQDFIVVPFEDNVDEPFIGPRPERLLDALNLITLRDTSDCPEDSLSGIQKALEISKPSSDIYVFTDAFAKYDTNFKEIETLCRETQSKVVIFLSGSCPPYEPSVGDSIYYNISMACSGTVLRVDELSFKKAFRYVKEMIQSDYDDVVNEESFIGYKQFNYQVESFTSDLLIAISGEYPMLHFVDKYGKSPDVEKMFESEFSLVARLSNLAAGEYRVTVRCHGEAHITFHKKNNLPFGFGFSPKSGPNSLKETSSRPIPGRTNTLLIYIQESYNIRINTVELNYLQDGAKITLVMEERADRKGLYTAETYTEPGKRFKMTIIGTDLTNYKDIGGTTNVIEPQTTTSKTASKSPSSEIILPDGNFIYFGSTVTIACKVKGYPKPDISWEDAEYNALTSEEYLLEAPSTYISYVTLEAVKKNMTLYCKSKNRINENVEGVQLFVNRSISFDVLEAPSDTTIEYGSSGELRCVVDAYPEATIKWYHNGTSTEYSDNKEVYDGNNLRISKMTLNDVGEYTCEASNGATTQRLPAYIYISGLEIPEVTMKEAEFRSKPGDQLQIECRVVKGNPSPKVTWKYKSEGAYDFGKLPSDVVISDKTLIIYSVTSEHKGLYRCMASNVLGDGSYDVTVKIQYAPQILNNDNGSPIEVRAGEQVELTCDVDAVPTARVRWEMLKGDVIEPVDSTRHTNQGHRLRFVATPEDSRSYYCVAENEMGSATKVVEVNVLVSPYIERPIAWKLKLAAGSNYTLICNVSQGNPVPTTRWEFIAVDSTASIIARGSSSLDVNLTRVTRANAGQYLCITNNKLGNDRIRINVGVQ